MVDCTGLVLVIAAAVRHGASCERFATGRFANFQSHLTIVCIDQRAGHYIYNPSSPAAALFVNTHLAPSTLDNARVSVATRRSD